MNIQSFITNRYRREKKMTDKTKERKMIAQTWLRDDNVGAWRHTRMISGVDPIIESYPKARWLTVGDGRYGKEAHYLLRKGARVTASNISDELLKIAKEMGYISTYKVENAEKLSFRDDAFDFILCQESLHHFPRPFLGLYEMIRVAKKGVIITEPNDIFHDHTFPQKIFWNAKITIKKVLGISEIPPFEPIGNYLYRVSLSEIEKISTALNLETIAYKQINDKYYEGVEFAPVGNSMLFLKVKIWISILDLFVFLGFLKSNCISIIIWKIQPPKICIQKLQQKGFRVIPLPKNPYM